ncbi:MAG TPA: hypothetical protein GX523_06715 [Desulfitobacterium dehalogenans]|uniref:Uncharacterized protein n=1 Tax=Desulfitobacterium dehalogenans TaxID=36854 RepID=A0A7C7D534_9FIRM|nr:hypothetical protein [Desulfitobacterium dehalogenans]
MDKDLVKEFKRLTGSNLADIADKFGVSRQFIHSSLNNKSLTYRASSAFYLMQMIDEKIAELKQSICLLEQLKKSIESEVIESSIESDENIED